MPKRNLILATNEIYHVFNRSIAKENIFSSIISFMKPKEIVEFYRFPQKLRLSKFKTLTENLKNNYLLAMQSQSPLIEIYAFSLMPNHYHFLVKQLLDNGLARFVSNFQNSFAKVFNIKNDRDGALFQNSFKAKRIETDEQFIHVSRYIHLNPVTAYLIKFDELKDYPLTSFPNYVYGNKDLFVNIKFLLDMFKSAEDYIKFVADQVGYQRELASVRDLIIE